MYVRPFEYSRVTSVAEAAALLRHHGDGARLLAGGQSLLPMINLGLAQPELLIGIGHLPELRGVTRQDGEIIIGACTTYAALAAHEVALAHLSLLVAAIRHVGNVRVRNQGTLGGSVAHADPAAETPLVLCVLDARCEASDGERTRQIPAVDFAQSYYTTALAEGEILSQLRVPLPAAGTGWGFHEYSRRAGDFAIVAAAATVQCRDGAVAEARVGLAGVADTPVRCRALEAAAVGTKVAELDGLVDQIDADLMPKDDPFVSAEYRRHLARVLILRALRDACSRATEVQ